MSNALLTALAQARKTAKMTQAELAERAGLSRMTVQRTEGGDLDPRYSTLAEMARVLGMELMAVPSGLHAQVQAFIEAHPNVPAPAQPSSSQDTPASGA